MGWTPPCGCAPGLVDVPVRREFAQAANARGGGYGGRNGVALSYLLPRGTADAEIIAAVRSLFVRPWWPPQHISVCLNFNWAQRGMLRQSANHVRRFDPDTPEEAE
jgi:hypothetical protein